ncbi:bifunctional UDP-N-acetylglucosamine diphosphorylase/glucosamine-1-phosphate N-acetyltransferase GlmU [Synergistes jonesii]|uniref:bifunctional UDP-N-acetylglucosamine diphosphorylase/glucosamine-1-phosphate N-acetyltransferase GlmU n=1 Tax=Synergistes jonesii TaxID=2754 RepID=UPI00242EDC5A|nr:bifunctional UDP-N-acetylglucosamine diphosphorylase/glucosamine-1-phosphate N-acetyltransferase GlmU [Synergistes jonesii]
MKQQKKSFGVLVLAAGKGTRMRSKTPKVLHTVLEEPILYYPLKAAQSAGFSESAVVVGFGGEAVSSWLESEFPKSEIIWQREQKGTAHAAKLAQRWWSSFDNVMILAGDAPLVTPETLSLFAARHKEEKNACSFLSFDLDDPTGYGRVIRGRGGVSVVEHKDATEEQRAIKEVNSGMYIFDSEALASVIDKISPRNAQGEYYLPDALSLIEEEGGSVDAIKSDAPDEFLGVNDQLQLAKAASVMRDRIVKSLMLNNGMHCMDPRSVWIGPKVKVGRDVTIHPSVQLWGDTVVEDGAFIGSFTVLKNSTVRANANLKGSVRLNDSTVGERASAGPFAFMREHAELLVNAHVGRFVEIKKSKVGKDSKVPHLSYIGDAEIGENTNIGAGTITCNYDGEKKNTTKIGRDCFVGSDTMFVAPVTVGDDVSTAAGSVITQDIPDGALGVARARQTNIEGWSRRRRHKMNK